MVWQELLIFILLTVVLGCLFINHLQLREDFKEIIKAHQSVIDALHDRVTKIEEEKEKENG